LAPPGVNDEFLQGQLVVSGVVRVSASGDKVQLGIDSVEAFLVDGTIVRRLHAKCLPDHGDPSIQLPITAIM
jgi:hypothetical protein